MENFRIATSAGQIGFAGRLHASRGRPAVLAVNGAFPADDHFHQLVRRFGHASVLVANLPGMGVPWSDATPTQLATGLSEAIDVLFGGQPLIVLGASTGALVTFGLRRPSIVRHIAMEPFFSTQELWPFIDWARDLMLKNAGNENLRQYFWTTFGIGPDRLENRDYRHLLRDIATPTDVIMGQLPLQPPRRMIGWPSFTAQPDREALAANPLVTVYEGPAGSGHGLYDLPEGEVLVAGVVEAALLSAALNAR